MFLKKKQQLINFPYIVTILQKTSAQKRNAQKGSALVIAIFIIIVISLLGAALVNMLRSSQEKVAYEVLGTRAYTAAQSGVQWQLSETFPLNSNAVACKSQTVIDSTTPSFNGTKGLTQCSVSVSCSDFERTGIRYFTIKSTGQCDIDGEVTARTIEVEARSLL
jgi:MSHA biogenesis protein MshP